MSGLSPLSIFIYHQGNSESLRRTLSSLHEAWMAKNRGNDPVSIEIIDDGTTVQLADEVKGLVDKEKAVWGEMLKFRRFALPHGWCHVMNEQWATGTRFGYVFFLHSGLEVRGDFFAALQLYLVMNTQETRVFLPVISDSYSSTLGGHLQKWRLKAKKLSYLKILTKELDFFPKEALMVPVDAWRGDRPWSHRLKNYGADLEMSLRLKQKHWGVQNMPEVWIYNRSSQEYPLEEIRQAQDLLSKLYFPKWQQALVKTMARFF